MNTCADGFWTGSAGSYFKHPSFGPLEATHRQQNRGFSWPLELDLYVLFIRRLLWLGNCYDCDPAA